MEKRETGLTIQSPAGMIPFKEIQSMAAVYHESGLFPDIRSMAQAAVKIMAGIELGFGPVYSLQKIYIVKGKTMVAAEAMGAMVKKSGRYDYHVIKLDDNECELAFTDNGKDVYHSKFTMEDARRADLVQPGSGWAKWPRAMLMSKALSQGARIVCPHVISGVYTPEDFGFSTNPETEIIEGLVEDIEKPPAEKPQTVPEPRQDEQGTAYPAPAVESTTPQKKQARDAKTIKTTTDLYKACFADFGIQPNDDCLKELNITRWADMTDTPAEAYAKIAQVHG